MCRQNVQMTVMMMIRMAEALTMVAVVGRGLEGCLLVVRMFVSCCCRSTSLSRMKRIVETRKEGVVRRKRSSRQGNCDKEGGNKLQDAKGRLSMERGWEGR